jgi:hypothetical protein
MTPQEREIHAAKMRLANLPRREREAWKLTKAKRAEVRRRLYDQAQADYKLIAAEETAAPAAILVFGEEEEAAPCE